MLFLSYQMRPLNVRPGVPNGMITYQLSGTPENVAAYNAVWQEKGVMDTARNHIWFWRWTSVVGRGDGVVRLLNVLRGLRTQLLGGQKSSRGGKPGRLLGSARQAKCPM